MIINLIAKKLKVEEGRQAAGSMVLEKSAYGNSQHAQVKMRIRPSTSNIF